MSKISNIFLKTGVFLDGKTAVYRKMGVISGNPIALKQFRAVLLTISCQDPKGFKNICVI